MHYKVLVRFAFNDWIRNQSNLLNVFHPNIPRPPTWIQSIVHLQCEYHRVSSPDCEVKAWSWKSCLLRKATRRVISFSILSLSHCNIVVLHSPIWNFFSAALPGSVLLFSFLHRVPVRGALRFCRHVPDFSFCWFQVSLYFSIQSSKCTVWKQSIIWVSVILSLRPVRLSSEISSSAKHCPCQKFVLPRIYFRSEIYTRVPDNGCDMKNQSPLVLRCRECSMFVYIHTAILFHNASL